MCDIMRHTQITFEDWEFEKLEKAKGTMTWREFILQLIPEKAEIS